MNVPKTRRERAAALIVLQLIAASLFFAAFKVGLDNFGGCVLLVLAIRTAAPMENELR